jgi:hypothetical protein
MYSVTDYRVCVACNVMLYIFSLYAVRTCINVFYFVSVENLYPLTGKMYIPHPSRGQPYIVRDVVYACNVCYRKTTTMSRSRYVSNLSGSFPYIVYTSNTTQQINKCIIKTLHSMLYVFALGIKHGVLYTCIHSWAHIFYKTQTTIFYHVPFL